MRSLLNLDVSEHADVSSVDEFILCLGSPSDDAGPDLVGGKSNKANC